MGRQLKHVHKLFEVGSSKEKDGSVYRLQGCLLCPKVIKEVCVG